MPDLPPITRPETTYDWTGHHRLLTTHPDEWHLLEQRIPSAWSSLIRSGKQPELAPLLGHLDVRMRATTLDGKTRVGQLWARYTPAVKVTPKRNAQRRTYAEFTDDQVRTIRERRAAGVSAADLAAEYGASTSYIRALVRGDYRSAAGGPLQD